MQEIEQIYTQYRQDVYRYLCSLTRDAALAEDLLSETFLRALTGLSGFRKGACVRTWLFSIARHVWIDGLRRKRHVLSGDELLARYVEEQITSDGIDSLSWNTDYGNSQMVYPDAMMLTKSGKSFSATFTSGIMYTGLGDTLRTFRMVDSIQLHKGRQRDFRSF